MKTIFTLFFSCILLQSISQNTFFKKAKVERETIGSRFIQTTDGGLLQVCNTPTREQFTSYSIAIVKYDSLVNVQWSRVYQFKDSILRSIGNFHVGKIKDGYLVSANVSQYPVIDQLLVFRINSTGAILWSKMIAMPAMSNDHFYSNTGMMISNDGKAYFIGYQQDLSVKTNAFMMKLDAENGDINWLKTTTLKHRSGNTFYATDMTLNNDGTINVIGNGIRVDYPRADYIPWMIKYGSNGNILDKHFYSFGENNDANIELIGSTPDNGYVTIGKYFGFHRDATYDICLTKFDQYGSVEWTEQVARKEINTYIHRNSSREHFFCLTVDKKDSSYLVGGALSGSYLDEGGDFRLKIDSKGNILWFNHMPRFHSNVSVTHIFPTNDQGYLLAGNDQNRAFYNSVFFNKVDARGNSCRGQYVVADTSYAGSSKEVPGEVVMEDLTSLLVVTDPGLIRNPASTGVGSYCSNVVLPINFIDFTAVRSGTANNLKWSVSNMLNADEFEIERSNDGTHFSSLAAVESTIADKTTTYTFTDKQPAKNVNYYRIKMVDENGKALVSKIVIVNNNGAINVNMYPTQVRDIATLYFNNDVPVNTQISIINMEGKVIYIEKYYAAGGASTKSVDASALTQGLYFVKIKTDNGETNLRFMKY